DRDLLPDEGVGQRRLAGVGASDDAGKTGPVCRRLSGRITFTCGLGRILGGACLGAAHVMFSDSCAVLPAPLASSPVSWSCWTRSTSTVATRRRRPAIRSAVRRSPATSV